MKSNSFFIFIALLFIHLSSFADDRGVSEGLARPHITAQRAIVKYKDGVQTVIMQSSLSSDAQELGWLVALPTVPTSVKQIGKGLFTELSGAAPTLLVFSSADARLLFNLTFFLMILYVLLLLMLNKIRFIHLVVLLLFVCVIFAAEFTNMSRSRGTKTNRSLDLTPSKAVGNYDIEIIKPDSKKALGDWLVGQKISPLLAAQDTLVTNYIEKGWCFVAIKLHRTESGESVVHPLSFTFSSKKSIYPMALNTLGTSGSYFEFYVLGDAVASHPQLMTNYVKKFSEQKPLKCKSGEACECEVGPPLVYYGSFYSGGLTDFSSADLFWDGMVVTKLSARLETTDLVDLEFNSQEYLEGKHFLVYLKRTARVESISKVFVISAWILVMTCLVVISNRILQKDSELFVRSVLIVTCFLGFIIYNVGYAQLTIIDPKINLKSSAIKCIDLKEYLLNFKKGPCGNVLFKSKKQFLTIFQAYIDKDQGYSLKGIEKSMFISHLGITKKAGNLWIWTGGRMYISFPLKPTNDK